MIWANSEANSSVDSDIKNQPESAHGLILTVASAVDSCCHCLSIIMIFISIPSHSSHSFHAYQKTASFSLSAPAIQNKAPTI